MKRILWAGLATFGFTSILPSAASGQLDMGQIPGGVRVDVLDESYTVRGATFDEVATALRAGRWYRYRWRIEWTHHSKPVANSSISGTAQNTCETDRLDILLRFTTIYPKWEPRAEPEERLAEAWAEFDEEVRSHWAEHRDVAVETAREMISRTRRFRQPCPLLFREAQELVDRIVADGVEKNLEIDKEYRPGWPPPGYESVNRRTRLADSSLDPDPAEPTTPISAVETEPDAPPASTPERRAPPPPVVAEDIYSAVRRDVGVRTSGLGIGLMHEGEVRYLESFGTPVTGSEEILLPGSRFAFPALSEVMLGVAVDMLHDAGSIDPDAPISTYLPDLSERLGSATLDQLLQDRAGLDNARVPDSTSWRTVLDRLDDRAVFTDPGAVTSYSRYSYPLAARVVEAVTGQRYPELIESVFLAPLAMDSTTLDPKQAIGWGMTPARVELDTNDYRDPMDGPGASLEGLPIVYTTIPDVLTFLHAWMSGDLPGADVSHEAEERSFRWGVWQERVGDAPRTSRVCEAAGFAAGFYLFPETLSAAVLFGAGNWPESSANFTLSAIDTELGIGDPMYAYPAVAGGAQLNGEDNARCRQPQMPYARLGENEAPVPSADWAGRYVNGDRFARLDDVEGVLHYTNGTTQMPVVHWADDRYFTLLAGRPGFLLGLKRDAEGRRYLVQGSRAYIHEDDRGR